MMLGVDHARGPAAPAESAPGPSLVRFGPFELDLQECEIYRDGRPLDLQAQPARLLALLVGDAGRLVTRERIQATLWEPGTYVDVDQGINHCVRQLRTALGDDADSPRFVATVRRRGYRFVADVEWVLAEDPPVAASDPDRRARGSWRWRWAVGAAAGLAIVVLTLLMPRRSTPVAAPPEEAMPILAVLPFKTLTSGADDNFFSDALTEELIAQLGRRYAARLGVIARTSAMQYKETTKGVGEIGRELGASFILEGSVRHSGERVRITAQLVRVADASHLWAANFDRTNADVIDLQEEVSEKIARALGLELLPGETREWAAATTPEAYEAYLQGRAWLRDFDPRDPQRHIRALEEAVRLDAGFAPAWAALAEAYRTQAEPSTVSAPRAREAVRKALSLNDNLPEAHLTLALIRFYYDWDLEGSGQAFQRAVDLHPGYAEAWHAYAAYFSVSGDHERALEAVMRARALDPLSPFVTSDIGWYSYFARRYDEAIERCRDTLAAAPRFYWGHRCVVFAALQAGDRETARAQMLVEMEQREATEAEVTSVRAGDLDAALRSYWTWDLARHRRMAEGTDLSPSLLAMNYLARDEHEAALDLLEQAVDLRSGWILPFLRVEPMVDPLRDDVRFRALMERITDRAVLRSVF